MYLVTWDARSSAEEARRSAQRRAIQGVRRDSTYCDGTRGGRANERNGSLLLATRDKRMSKAATKRSYRGVERGQTKRVKGDHGVRSTRDEATSTRTHSKENAPTEPPASHLDHRCIRWSALHNNMGLLSDLLQSQSQYVHCTEPGAGVGSCFRQRSIQESPAPEGWVEPSGLLLGDPILLRRGGWRLMCRINPIRRLGAPAARPHERGPTS